MLDGADVARVDATTGALTLLAPGEATVRVSATETANYKEASVDVKVSVTSAEHAVTFYEDTDGTKVWKTVRVADGTPLEQLAGYGTDEGNRLEREGYTLAGWATEPGIVVKSYCDKNGVLDPMLVDKLVFPDEVPEGEAGAKSRATSTPTRSGSATG